MSETVLNLLRLAASLREEGRGVMGCLLVETRGSTPQDAGALLIVDDQGATHGTIGGGCVEAEIGMRARTMIEQGTSGRLSFTLDHDHGWDDGMLCGGSLELALAPMPDARTLRDVIVHVESRRETALELRVDEEGGPAVYRLRLPPRDRLYVAGGGHLGAAVARLGLALDFDVSVFDDRADLLDRLVPRGAERVHGDIAECLAAAGIDDRTYAVIATRGHRHDEQALAAVVGRGARYVGMLGSRRKVRVVFEDLGQRGVPADALALVHAPIGLDIGAESVEEIALAIAAEIVQVRRAGAEGSGERVECAKVVGARG